MIFVEQGAHELRRSIGKGIDAKQSQYSLIVLYNGPAPAGTTDTPTSALPRRRDEVIWIVKEQPFPWACGAVGSAHDWQS